jgi:hypothetical protein
VGHSPSATGAIETDVAERWGSGQKGSSAKPFVTPLKPFSPTVKAFYVADEPIEGSKPEGEQKPKGSLQPFDESD